MSTESTRSSARGFRVHGDEAEGAAFLVFESHIPKLENA
jgi:hypothetical protein